MFYCERCKMTMKLTIWLCGKQAVGQMSPWHCYTRRTGVVGGNE